MNFQKNVLLSCEKGQSKEHFQLQSFIPTGKTHNTAKLSPLSLFHGVTERTQIFLPVPEVQSFHQLSCFSGEMQSTPQLSPNDTQPLSLNLERKPVHIAPVFKEIPKEILPTQCTWSTVAILSCAAPVGTGGSLRPLPVQTILFSSVSKAG